MQIGKTAGFGRRFPADKGSSISGNPAGRALARLPNSGCDLQSGGLFSGGRHGQQLAAIEFTQRVAG